MSDLSYLHVMMKQVFRDVYVVKPESSRAMSAESFVVGLGFLASANLRILSDSIAVLHSDEPPEESNLQRLEIKEERKEEDD